MLMVPVSVSLEGSRSITKLPRRDRGQYRQAAGAAKALKHSIDREVRAAIIGEWLQTEARYLA